MTSTEPFSPFGQRTTSTPEVTQSVPDVSGGGSNVVHDVSRAGLDPVAAFGAASGLHWATNKDAIKTWANNVLGASPAPAGGQPAAKAAQHSLSKTFMQTGARTAAKQAGVLAAKRGAMLGAKAAAATALRLGAMSIPGLGTAITLALWCIDPSERRAVNNLISRRTGGAPALDAAPEPPRTQFLPLCHDGNRDTAIEQMDKGMIATNKAAFGYNPDDVWPTSHPNVATMSDFANTITKINAFNTKLTSAIESIGAAYQAHPDEQYVAQLWGRTKPLTEQLGDLQSTVLKKYGQQLTSAASTANDAYQAFRRVNLVNRQQINNSTSGLIPFLHNHVHGLSDSSAELKAGVQEMQRVAAQIAALPDQLHVKASKIDAAALSAADVTPQPDPPKATPVPAPLPSIVPQAPPAPQPQPQPAPVGDGKNDKDKAIEAAKDLTSALRNPMSGTPQMPPIPAFPGGGMPGGLNPAQLANQLPKPNPLDDELRNDELRKVLDDKAKPADDTKGDKKPEGTTLGGAQPVTTPVGAPKAQPVGVQPQPAPPGQPAPNNSTEIKGKPYHFDNPKLAQVAHNLSGTDGHKSLRQALTDAGYHLPDPGQDIGKQITDDKVKPGTVVMGAGDHNAYVLEAGDHPTVITEQGEVKPLSEVAHFDGSHQGYFELVDDGAPAPQTQTVAAPAAPASPAPAAPTQFGVPQGFAPSPLTPSKVPAGN